MLLVMDEVSILDGLQARNLQHRIEALEELRLHVRKQGEAGEKLAFFRLSDLFDLLNNALSDRQWSVRHQCVQLVCEIVPCLTGSDVESLVSRLISHLVNNAVDSKVAIRKAASQALQLYVKQSKSPVSAKLVITRAFFACDLKEERFNSLSPALLCQLVTNETNEHFYPLVELLTDEDVVQANRQLAVTCLSHVKQSFGVERYQSCINRLPAKCQLYYRLHLGGETECDVKESHVNGHYTRISPVRSEEEESVEFGFVPQSTMEKLKDKTQWRKRVEGIVELAGLIDRLEDARVIAPHLSSLVNFVLPLLDDTNFKVTLIALDIVERLITKVSLGLKSVLDRLVIGLSKKLGDNRIVREANMRVFTRLMQAVTPKPVLDALLPSLKHRSSRVREETINVIISALLTYPRYEFDLPALAEDTAPVLMDHKQRVRQAALELFAVLASSLGAGNLFTLVSIVGQIEQAYGHQMSASGDHPGVMLAVKARLARRQLPRINAQGLVEHANPLPISSATSVASHRPSVSGPDVDWVLAAPGTATPFGALTNADRSDCNVSAISTPTRLPSMNPVSAGPTPRRSAGKNRLPWEPDGSKEGKYPRSRSAKEKWKETATLSPAPPIKPKNSWNCKEQTDEVSKITLNGAVGSASPGSYAELHINKLKRSTATLTDSAVTSAVSLQSSSSIRAGRDLSPLVANPGKQRIQSHRTGEDKPPLPSGLIPITTVPSATPLLSSLKGREKQLLLGDTRSLSLTWPRQKVLGGSSHGREEQMSADSQRNVNPMPLKKALARPGSKKKKQDEISTPKRVKSGSQSPSDEDKRIQRYKNVTEENESLSSPSSDGDELLHSDLIVDKSKRDIEQDVDRKPKFDVERDVSGNVVYQKPVIARTVRTPMNKKLSRDHDKVRQKELTSHLPGPVKMNRRVTEPANVVLTRHDPATDESLRSRETRSETPEKRLDSSHGVPPFSQSLRKKVLEQSSSQRTGKLHVKQSERHGYEENTSERTGKGSDQHLSEQSFPYVRKSLRTTDHMGPVLNHEKEEIGKMVKEPVLAESVKKKAEELKQSSRQSLRGTSHKGDDYKDTKNLESGLVTSDSSEVQQKSVLNKRKRSNVGMAAVFPLSRVPHEKSNSSKYEANIDQPNAGILLPKRAPPPFGTAVENDCNSTASSDEFSSTKSSCEMDSVSEVTGRQSTKTLSNLGQQASVDTNHSNEASVVAAKSLHGNQVVIANKGGKTEPDGLFFNSSPDGEIAMPRQSEGRVSIESVGNVSVVGAEVDNKVEKQRISVLKEAVTSEVRLEANMRSVQSSEKGNQQPVQSHQNQHHQAEPVSGLISGSTDSQMRKETFVDLRDHVMVHNRPGHGSLDLIAKKQVSESAKVRGSIVNSVQLVPTQTVPTDSKQTLDYQHNRDVLSSTTRESEKDFKENETKQELEELHSLGSLERVDCKPVLAASTANRINSRGKEKRSAKTLQSETNKLDNVVQSTNFDGAVVGHGVQIKGQNAMKRQPSIENLKKDVDSVDISRRSTAAVAQHTAVSPVEMYPTRQSSSPEIQNQGADVAIHKFSDSVTKRLNSRDKPPRNVRRKEPRSEECEDSSAVSPLSDVRLSIQDPVMTESQSVINPDIALRDGLRYLASDDWEVKCKGLNVLQKLTEHHADTLLPQLKHVIFAVVREVKNLRSQVSRAAIQCLGQLYSSLGKGMDLDLDMTVKVLLDKGGEPSVFIRQDADKALSDMVHNVTPSRAVLAMTAYGVSHRNMAVRKTTAQMMYGLIELTGCEQVVRNSKEMLERILPAAVQFTMDGSPEARYYGRAIIHVLADYADVERLGPKLLSDKLQRQLLGVVEGLRTKGLGELPTNKSSAQRKRSLSNVASRASSGASKASEKGSRNVPPRRTSLASDIEGLSGKSVVPQNHDNHLQTFPISVLKGLASVEWRERYEAITELMQLTISSPALVGSNIVKIFDQLVPRLTDSNSKVNTYALQCFEVMLPNITPYLDSVISILIPALSCTLASKNPNIQQSGVSIIDHIIDIVDNSILVQPFSSVIQFGSVKAKPFMTDKLATLVDTVYTRHRKLVARHVLPVIWHLISSTQGGKSPSLMTNESRLAASKLIHIVFHHMGQILLDQARHLPPRDQATLESLMDTFGPS